MPSVYKIELNQKEDLKTLWLDILEDATVDNVHQKVGDYVTSVIEPVDWCGVWRTRVPIKDTFLDCDFQVEVVDVTQKTTDALVIVHKLLFPPVEELTTNQFDAVDDFMTKDKVRTVSLADIWVISAGDEDERFLETAVVVEHARFFYRYLWRPWDDIGTNSGSHEAFTTTRLETRINFYFDILEKKIPQSTISKVNQLLDDARTLRQKFDDIQDTLSRSQESVESGDEDFVDETDIMEAMKIQVRLEDIQRQVEIIEDPFRRMFIPRNLSDDDDATDSGISSSAKKIHIVAKEVTLRSFDIFRSKLVETGNQETPLLFHRCFGSALRACHSGDSIYITPGEYLCNSVPWIDFDVDIIGLGTYSKIIITASESIGDVFLNCAADNIRFTNLTLRTKSEMQSVITVHSGKTEVISCIVDSVKCSKSTIVALTRGSVITKNCKFVHETSESWGSKQGEQQQESTTGSNTWWSGEESSMADDNTNYNSLASDRFEYSHSSEDKILNTPAPVAPLAKNEEECWD